jgi:hypothetical protein
MKHHKPGAIKRPIQRKSAPDGYLEASLSWRTTRLVSLLQLLLSSEGENPIHRGWWEPM